MRIGTGSYSAQVTTASGSGEVLWEVYDLNGTTPSALAPIVVVPPPSQSVINGSVTLAAKVVGGGTLSYQWRKGGQNIEGATSAALTLSSVSATDAGSYDLVVGSSATTATATSAAATLHVIPSIASVTGPAAGSYKAGAILGFTANHTGAVTVTGTPRLKLTIGSATAYATYNAAASTSTALVFNYTVPAGATDTDGIAIATTVISTAAR